MSELFLWEDYTTPDGHQTARIVLPTPKPPKELHKPRDYQEEARQAVLAVRKAKKARAAVVIATGGGKTIIFSLLAQDWQPGRVLILTDQIDLIGQAVEKLRDTTGIIADIEQGDSRASKSAQVVVATIQTLKGRLGHWNPAHFDLVICDECDRAMAAGWQAVLAHFAQAFHVGFTATPLRADKKSILSHFERIVFRLGTFELIARGYLVKIHPEHVPLKLDLRGVKTVAGDFDAEQVADRVEPAFQEILEAWKERANGLRTLVFLPDIKTSVKFANVANEMGLNARHLDSGMRNREQIKRAYREGQFQILANPCLLGRGYDEPGIECIINLRATKSLSFYQQLCGRGTRLFCRHGCKGPCEHEDRKKRLLILDFLWQFDEMGPLSPSALIADDDETRAEIDAQIRMAGGEIDLEVAAERAQRSMEEKILQALKDAQKNAGAGKKMYFRPKAWAATMHQAHLADYLPESPEDAQPPTPSQLRKLTDAGFFPEDIDSTGLAREILKVITDRKKQGLASFKQLFWLIKKGATGLDALTVAQAGRLLDRAFAGEDISGDRSKPPELWDDHGVVDLGPEHDHEMDAAIEEYRKTNPKHPGYEFEPPAF